MRSDRSTEAFLRYALGQADIREEPNWPRIEGIADVFRFSFRRQRYDVRYVVETSPDLVNWHELTVNPGRVGEDVAVSVPMGAACFFRLRLEAASLH